MKKISTKISTPAEDEIESAAQRLNQEVQWANTISGINKMEDESSTSEPSPSGDSSPSR